MKRFFLVLIITCLFWPLNSQAAVLKSSYPRLANYFLKWEISDDEARELAQWDLLVLDMEVQENSPAQIRLIRELNPQVIILAYITPQEIKDDLAYYSKAKLRQRLVQQIDPVWTLKDSSGQKVSNWPGTYLLNISEGAAANNLGYKWDEYLPEFVTSEIKASGLWDGIFYDNIWSDITWLNNGNLDLNNDGQAENKTELNQLWVSGVKKTLARTRALVGNDWLIVVNGHSYDEYQKIINGLMLESFPSAWENGGTWEGSMKTYTRLPFINLNPPISIINVGSTDPENYRRLRFGLGSALLGDGFFSFDYGVTDHGQTWWYDEYNQKLGPAQSRPYNLLANKAEDLKPGLWRRDFKYGISLVNSTNQEQRYAFLKEELEKFSGSQDSLFNNGQKINYLKLAPQDGIILLKRDTVINNSAFTNGYFFRLFNISGEQVRNGFFAYLSNFPGEEEVIVANQNNDNQDVSLSAGNGQVNLYKNGRRIASFKPYDKLFKKQLSLAAQISDGYFRLVAVGPGVGGGPQVRLFTPDGKLKGSFFAYDSKFRGGVNVALGDVDGDGQLEVVTAPGAGLEPLVKIFSLQGKLKQSFLAYEAKFRGGVNIALGDVNQDGSLEIITGPGQGGGPQVRVFNASGLALKSFFAYDASYHGGIKIATSDLNLDGNLEILVGIRNFY